MSFLLNKLVGAARVLPRWALAGALVSGLLACGDGSDPTLQVTTQDNGAATFRLSAPLPGAVAALNVQPMFHAAPMLVNPPGDADRAGYGLSAFAEPHRQVVPPQLRQQPTRHRTPQAPDSDQTAADAATPVTQPSATGSLVATYTPAQVRAAYGFPALPVAGASPSVAQAASWGAGQTIYIVAAKHNPNAAAELAAFNQKFGLPACTSLAIAANASLPLAQADASGCTFSVVYSTYAGGMTATVPAYDAGWATEMALDVQWAHASAPWARIVLIEAPDASISGITGAVQLANKMGPGVVSMSLGALEGSWTASVDAAFSGANMTYLAASGDAGVQVNWPAVSTRVVAVGGTTLTYSGSGGRSEVVWSGTGGGTSLYTLAPSYQNNTVPGMSTLKFRTVSDVAFNADPATGQYVAVMSPGSTAVQWLSVGGTSLSTPQWAGLVAMANASRALSGLAALGAPHGALYGQVAAVPGNYASAFLDVTAGADGACATCFAQAGYDRPTGLGTPNASSLVGLLAGATAASAPPVLTSASIAGTAGSALSFTVSAIASNPVVYSLSGAPSGMAISAAGVVGWASPVAGTYAVTVTAKDTKTNLSGSAVYTVTIAAAASAVTGPVITASPLTGVAGKPLTGTIGITDASASSVSVSIGGAPRGMGFSASGMTITVSWPSPIKGSYTLTVKAVDSNGKSASKAVSVTISAK